MNPVRNFQNRRFDANFEERLSIRSISNGVKKIFGFVILVALCSLLYAQDKADNSSTLTRQGIMKSRGGYYQEAIALFDKAIAKDKENTLAYYQRGVAKAGLS